MVFEFSSQCPIPSPTDSAATTNLTKDSVAVGRKYAGLIEQWQKRAHFSEEAKWVSEMIQEDAQRCLELDEKLQALKAKIKEVAKDSKIARFYCPFLDSKRSALLS